MNADPIAAIVAEAKRLATFDKALAYYYLLSVLEGNNKAPPGDRSRRGAPAPTENEGRSRV